MGHRRKLVYQAGRLRDALSGEVVKIWNVRMERFIPADYRVELETAEGEQAIFEDEEGVWWERDGGREALTRSSVRLPAFAGPNAPLLRVLHGELLVNVLPWGPVPNLWVYSRPWYRDAAIMALCFERTNNLDLLAPWIEGLATPYDQNNRGESEPDNLGQVLMLVSFASGRNHSLVDPVLQEIGRIRQGSCLAGRTDGAEHPVYQTKWLKYGLQRLRLDDPFQIPAVPDRYSALFWMDFRDQHVPQPRFDAGALKRYPYLNWAEAHFYNEPPPENVSAEDFPLTRECEASEADYAWMDLVSSDWAAARWSSPHGWHAAEMFLYYHDLSFES